MSQPGICAAMVPGWGRRAGQNACGAARLRLWLGFSAPHLCCLYLPCCHHSKGAGQCVRHGCYRAHRGLSDPRFKWQRFFLLSEHALTRSVLLAVALCRQKRACGASACSKRKVRGTKNGRGSRVRTAACQWAPDTYSSVCRISAHALSHHTRCELPRAT